MAYLHPIATVLPETRYRQAEVAAFMQAQVQGQGGDRKLSRLLASIYAHSGIETRHSVLQDLHPERRTPGLIFEGERFLNPSTGVRNARYREAAGALFVAAARAALARSGLEPQSVTHVVTVSCTGFFAPGPDYLILRALDLSPATRRYHLGFMGCYAAFPALELAQSICQAEPEANVLVVCVELCSLHLQAQRDLDAVLSASLFADGGAAAVVSARPPEAAGALRLEGLGTQLLEAGEGDMAWAIGDHGFEMVLSSYVPELLGSSLTPLVEPLLAASGLSSPAVPHWAVHPGGRAILDRVACSLKLDEAQIAASRAVLAECGNMSSATVLFVLERLQQEAAPGEAIFGLAFGPGLTLASGRFTRV